MYGRKCTACGEWNCRILWSSPAYREGAPRKLPALTPQYVMAHLPAHRTKRNALIVYQSPHLRHFLFVQSDQLHHSRFIVSSGRRAIYSRMIRTVITLSSIPCVNNTLLYSQLFGEDEDDQGELDEALKQGENGELAVHARWYILFLLTHSIAKEIQTLRQEAQAFRTVRAALRATEVNDRHGAARKVFDKVCIQHRFLSFLGLIFIKSCACSGLRSRCTKSFIYDRYVARTCQTRSP